MLFRSLLMGFGFPTGMRLVTAIDPRPTPWFWAINGAAGVLAAGLAVAVSIALSIDACIWLGAVCYLPLGAAMVTALCVAWSLPNYFAALPSWYVIFFTTFGIQAFLRHVDSGRDRDRNGRNRLAPLWLGERFYPAQHDA